MADPPQENLYSLFLGLPEHIKSPNHYELLGIDLFTFDSKTIRDAAAKQNGKLLSWQNSKHHKQIRELILELVEARAILLDPEQKRVYDQQLRSITTETPVVVAVMLSTSLDTKPLKHLGKTRFKLALVSLAVSLLLFLVLLLWPSERLPEPGVSTEIRKTEAYLATNFPTAENVFEKTALSQLDSFQSPANAAIPLNEKDSLPQDSKTADSIVDELDSMFNELEKSTKTHARDDFSPEMNIDSNPSESESSEIFPGLPTLTRRTRTIFPLSPYRIKTGNLTYTNLNDLAFVGPEGNINLVGKYKTDGEWGIDRGVLKQVSGRNAAIAFAVAEDFELDTLAEVSGEGGCFFLIGWDGANGYLVYHYALRTTIHWRSVEIRDGAWIKETHKIYDSKFRPRGWQPILLSVNEKRLTWTVGDKALCSGHELPNYKVGAIILATWATQYGPKRLRIKSMKIRGK